RSRARGVARRRPTRDCTRPRAPRRPQRPAQRGRSPGGGRGGLLLAALTRRGSARGDAGRSEGDRVAWFAAVDRGPRRRATPGRPPATQASIQLAKSLLESRVVPDRREVVVPARLVAERREQLDGAPEMAEDLVAGLARKRREACVVVVEARVVGRVPAAAPDLVQRIGVALLP